MMKGKLIMALLLWMAVVNNVWGEMLYSVTVMCSEGEGYVYASPGEEPLSIDEISGWDDESDLWYTQDENYQPADGTPYWIYAKPAEGYQFLGWTNNFQYRSRI